MFYVYQISKSGMGLDEGYIGVSKEPLSRWTRHKAKNSDSNPRLKRAILKYNPEFKILASFDSLEEALWLEFTLRPQNRIGWNLAEGGGMPPHSSGETHPSFGVPVSKETREKQSKARTGRFGGHKHPMAKPVDIYCRDSNKCLAKNVVVGVWAKHNGYNPNHIRATARGELKSHKGVYARYTEEKSQ